MAFLDFDIFHCIYVVATIDSNSIVIDKTYVSSRC